MRSMLSIFFMLVILIPAVIYAADKAPIVTKPSATTKTTSSAVTAAAKSETATITAQKPFTVPALPYGYSALAPVIDTETMQLHHDKHHQVYVDKLNDAVAKDTGLQGLSLEKILGNVSNYEQVVRDNAGGHYNHSLYWRLMAPKGQGGQPSPELLAQINTDFGSLDKFKAAFEEAGVKRFGSGWVWLIWSNGKLVVASTANQDNPLMDDAVVEGKPILANDVWEHAYYLTYRNKRADYLKAWWGIVNWNEANTLFAAARK